jgi:hypothetical protein
MRKLQQLLKWKDLSTNRNRFKATLKKKLDVDFTITPFRACNPASLTLLAEDKIGTMLPCVIRSKGQVEVSAVDPAASMQAVESAALGEIATEIRDKLQK